MNGSPVKIAILFSGRGSNMKSLAAHIARADVPAEFVLALCNRPDAGGIKICEAAGIACSVIDHKSFDSREAFDAKLDETLRAANIDLICCAGFMRLLTEDFVNCWPDRLLNIHPSLLPKYKGIHTHKRALEAGDKNMAALFTICALKWMTGRLSCKNQCRCWTATRPTRWPTALSNKSTSPTPRRWIWCSKNGGHCQQPRHFVSSRVGN